MDFIIQHLKNLKIETTHSSSSQGKVKRNWVELPPDIMSLIFMKLGPVITLGTAQWVCTSWWKLSKQPHLFRSVYVGDLLTLYGRRSDEVPLCYMFKLFEGMVREAIDRSCGQLVEFSAKYIADDELLHYMSETAHSLRSIRIIDCNEVSVNGLIKLANKLPLLEVLEIIRCSSISEYVFEEFGCCCPQLKTCRVDYRFYDEAPADGSVALAIALHMPKLRHLNLYRNKLTDDVLRAVLDGCPHLESLDLRECFELRFTGDLKERCRKIKSTRLPSDPTDDFKYYYDEDNHPLSHDINNLTCSLM